MLILIVILLQMQVPRVAQYKQVYVLKKADVPINAENYRELLLYGIISPSPLTLLQLSSTVEQVIVKTSVAVSYFCYAVF